jgi:hypothetical protein
MRRLRLSTPQLVLVLALALASWISCDRLHGDDHRPDDHDHPDHPDHDRDDAEARAIKKPF